MIKRIILFIFLISLVLGQKRSPAKYWESLEFKEKVAFVNGVYAAGAKFKFHHKQEVKKQFNQDPNWVEPYYIERFYEIIDEHRAKKAGYQVNLIAQALDAFYSNYDNTAIPLLEAVRIVSLAQDEEIEKADLYLLKAQKRYKP
jgi:valyl-tRNA synthetase